MENLDGGTLFIKLSILQGFAKICSPVSPQHDVPEDSMSRCYSGSSFRWFAIYYPSTISCLSTLLMNVIFGNLLDFDDFALLTLSTFVTWVAAGSMYQSGMVRQDWITKTVKSNSLTLILHYGDSILEKFVAAVVKYKDINVTKL